MYFFHLIFCSPSPKRASPDLHSSPPSWWWGSLNFAWWSDLFLWGVQMKNIAPLTLYCVCVCVFVCVWGCLKTCLKQKWVRVAWTSSTTRTSTSHTRTSTISTRSFVLFRTLSLPQFIMPHTYIYAHTHTHTGLHHIFPPTRHNKTRYTHTHTQGLLLLLLFPPPSNTCVCVCGVLLYVKRKSSNYTP